MKKVLNVDFLNEATSGDLEMRDMLFEIFTKQLFQDLHIINNETDYKILQKTIHKLYGSCSNIGAEKIAQHLFNARNLDLHDIDILTEFQNKITIAKEELIAEIKSLQL